MKLPRLAGFALLLPLAACSSLLDVQRTPFTIYSPQLSARPVAGPDVGWQLAVETPLASDVLDSTRIAVMPSAGIIEVFPGARWSDNAPVLLRNLLVQAFEGSDRITGVGSAVTGIRADYALAMELYAFQLDLTDGAPHAVVRLQARLVDYASNRVLASHLFETTMPAAGTDVASAFAALEAALNDTVSTIVAWTLATGERQRADATP